MRCARQDDVPGANSLSKSSIFDNLTEGVIFAKGLSYF
jgi:hypothetical protein